MRGQASSDVAVESSYSRRDASASYVGRMSMLRVRLRDQIFRGILQSRRGGFSPRAGGPGSGGRVSSAGQCDGNWRSRVL